MKTHTDSAPIESVCRFCDQSYECSVIKTAMAIIQREIDLFPNSLRQQKFDEYKRKLAEKGFHYPNSSTFCQLQDKKHELDNLFNEVMRLGTYRRIND